MSHVRGAKTDGTDTLTSVEQVKFSDQSFALAANSVRTQTDFALVVDTTGSMASYIGTVKARMAEIVDKALNSGTIDAHISIVGFKDPGETQTILAFTDQDDLAARKAAAIAAIDGISVSGGGDFPEGDNSGLLHALKGDAGEFRDTAVKRDIAMFTDASVKDTYLAAEVARYAADIGVSITSAGARTGALGSVNEFTFPAAADGSVPAPVRIFSILVGDNDVFDPSVRDDVAALAQNGGRLFDTDNLDDLVNALFEIIDTPANSPPVIVSDGGGDDAGISVAEGGLAVTTVLATDADAGAAITYGIAGGADADLFAIDAGSGKLAFLAAPNFERPGDAGGDNAYDVVVSASDGLILDAQALSVVVTDVAEGGGALLPGTDGPDQHRLPDEGPRPTGVALFGQNDTLVLDKALRDSNRDGGVTFGGNRLLDLPGGGTLDVAGVDPARGLRSIGGKGGELYYADAGVKPKSAIEGTVGDDRLKGTSKADVFFYDTALGAGLGNDTVRDFGAGDRLVTTSAVCDGDGDGRIGFVRDKLLNLPGPEGGSDPSAGSVALFGTSGDAITSLHLIRSSTEDGVTYYVYGSVGGASSAPILAF